VWSGFELLFSEHTVWYTYCRNTELDKPEFKKFGAVGTLSFVWAVGLVSLEQQVC
jgi:hypothetical protein